MKILITGGAGFIGSNVARSFGGQHLTILDNLSRKGCADNLEWLRQTTTFDFIHKDIRDSSLIDTLIAKGRFDVVIHLAGQVAVTTSLEQPRMDLEVNTLGTFNILEAIRRYSPETALLNASTNKVYGTLPRFSIRECEKRYCFSDDRPGVSEEEPVDFHSPYGCSKGAAEQYVLDYSRVYGIRSVSFRQSCVYGERQFGSADQGWAAWFLIAHLIGSPITVFGNGKQVRDMLHVDDLVDAYRAAVRNMSSVSGEVFNIGGGPENTLSLLEYFEFLANLSGREVLYSLSESRPGDQKVYISDISRAKSKLSWSPSIELRSGLRRLYDWVVQNRHSFVTLPKNRTI
jgi:CDP-paratose 2-epimerase